MQNLLYLKEKVEDKFAKDKKYCKFRDHYHSADKYKDAAYTICNFKYSIPNEISLIFHNGSSYDYHFVINKLAEEFEGNLLV